MQINSTNFFRWFTGSVVDETINFPRLGIADAKMYLPCLVPGEETGFYINSDIPFYDADQLTDLQLRLTDGTVIGSIMQKVSLPLGYRLYATFTFPSINVGQYQYEIYNTATTTVKCISNYFQVISPIDALTTTTTVKWRNSRDAYYYDWSLVPDFYCELRLNLSLITYQPEETIEQTKAVSTGIRRNNNYDTDLAYKLNTYYFDDGANLACIPLFKADELIINGKNYIQKTAYNPNARAISNVSVGEIELYDQYFSRINKFGQLPQLVLKTGKYVLVNNTAVDFTINKYSSANVAIGKQVVPAGTAYKISINDLQINSYVNLTAAIAGSYEAVTSHSMPDGSFVFGTNTITTTAATNQVTQNQIYGNDYFVVIS